MFTYSVLSQKVESDPQIMGAQRKRPGRNNAPPRNRAVVVLKKRADANAPHTTPRTEEEFAHLQAELKDLEQEVRNSHFSLKQLREEMAELMEFSPVGYFTLNSAGGIESLNTTAATMLGREGQMIRTHPFPALVSQESVSAFLAHLAMVQREPGRQTVEIKITRSDRSVMAVVMESRAFHDQHDKVKIRSTMVDVTERRRLEEERRRLEERLRQAEKMEAIGTLAGGIAHDFNNILAAIIGFTEIVIDDVADNPKIQQKMKRILQAGLRGRNLVKQILAFSRKAEGKRQEVNLAALTQESYGLLRASLPSTIKMHLAISTTNDCVLADPTQLQQVVMNLATNAADAMRDEGGELTIDLSSVVFGRESVLPDPDMKRGAYVRLTVRDTGAGMGEEVRQRAFEPFFTTKAKGKGTGMGLAVVYGVVKNHGGAVTVQSQVGQGSTFEVFLPQVRRTEKAEQEAPSSPLPTGTERILFVDDEEPLVAIGKSMLESLGYRVTTAQSGSEAWSLFLEEPYRFDLVITDQTMPDITGITLAQKMLRVRKELPVILCTGYSETVSAERAREAGISTFVMKPMAKRELAETVRRALDVAD